MTTFIDTSAFYALLSHTDLHHGEATARWSALLDDSASQLLTSNYVVVETCALVRNRLGMPAVNVFLRDLLPAATILWVDAAVHLAATGVDAYRGGAWPQPH